MMTRIGTSIAVALSVALAWGTARAQEGMGGVPTSVEISQRVKYPTARIPFMKKPPEVDGVMKPGEWEDAAAYTGFWQDFGGGAFPYLASREKQATYWIAYDKEFLYFAHKSIIFPEGAWLKCKAKYRDVEGHQDYGILWDDHVQFELAPTAEPLDVSKKGWFKMMMNPIDTVSDTFCNFTHGPLEQDGEWQSGMVQKGQWDENAWVTELKVPLKSFVYRHYDGKDAKGQPLVSLPLRDGTVWLHWGNRALGAGGQIAWLFSATHPASWEGVTFRWVFDSKGVTAQVRDYGYLFRDRVDLDIELKNHGERSEAVKVGFYVENDSELILMNEEEAFVELLPGEVKQIRIQRDKIGITPLGDKAWVDIRTLNGKIVYQSPLMTFHHLLGVPDYKEVLIDGMKFYREPRKPFEYRWSYYPYANKILAFVDTDVFGSTEEAKKAVEAKISLLTETGENVAEMTFPLEPGPPREDVKTWGGKTGHGIVGFEPLPDGMYKTVCLLYDEDKKIVADQTSVLFEAKHFPWEHNKEGIEDILWEPYTPLAVDTNAKTVETVMQAIDMAPSGMPKQITLKGDIPAFGPQLRAPFRFEASAGGKRFAYESKGGLKQVKDWKSEVAFETTGAVGPVRTRSRVRYEFDGYMLYDLHYKAEASIDTLELVIDLAGSMDMLDLHGKGRGLYPELLRKDPGVIWNSRDDMEKRELYYGNFTGHIFLGNGDRAFTWMCETDRGMKLLEENIAAQVEKNEDGEFTLRLFFVNEPGTVPEEKHVQFAFLTSPTKPRPANRRWNTWNFEGAGGGPIIGDGMPQGYSIHLEKDEGYALYKDLYWIKDKEGNRTDRKSRPYTTVNIVNWSLPAMKSLTYTGSWTGRTDRQPKPTAFSLQGGVAKKNPVTGTAWNTIFHKAHEMTAWTQSRVDNWVYWRSKQIRLARLSGWWWDHAAYEKESYDPVVGTAWYMPKHKKHRAGRLQYGFNYFLPRQMFKRITRIIAKEGMRPTSASWPGFNTIINEAFMKDCICWEGAAGYASGRCHMETFPLHQMRYCAETYTGNGCEIIENTNWVQLAGCDPAADRSNLAHALLHNIGANKGRFANRYLHRDVYDALEAFGFFAEGDHIEWIPYWRSDGLWRYGPEVSLEGAEEEFMTEEEAEKQAGYENVICSIYRDTKAKKALLILANNSETPAEDYLYLPDELLGKRPTKVTDVEVDQVVSPMRLNMGNQWGDNIPNNWMPVHIDKWQFRMLVVE